MNTLFKILNFPLKSYSLLLLAIVGYIMAFIWIKSFSPKLIVVMPAFAFFLHFIFIIIFFFLFLFECFSFFRKNEYAFSIESEKLYQSSIFKYLIYYLFVFIGIAFFITPIIIVFYYSR